MKISSPFEMRGSLGSLIFFVNEYGQQAKEGGGPTPSQVKHHERFDKTRRNAAEWKGATAASRLFRLAMGHLLEPVNSIRLSSRMNGWLLPAIKGDTVHEYGKRVISSGDLSLLPGFEFNHNLELGDALPFNIYNHYSLEGGKLLVDIPAFRIRRKKGLPAGATHYRLVSSVVTIDFDKRKYQQDKQVGGYCKMGNKAGTAFSIGHVVQPPHAQGCFWLMGIEFYKTVNELSVLVRGGALRVMEWIGKACVEERTTLSLQSEQEYTQKDYQMIELIQGDITKTTTDAIVNAANTSLLGGGGVDGAIHRAGGPQILEECQQIRSKQGGCEVGEAVITTGGNLPAKFVIHTVGPVWNNGQSNEEALLASAYHNSLLLAIDHGIKSIAFPNISTGIYRFPKIKAAQIAIKTVKDFLAQHHKPEKVVFVCYDAENYEVYDKLLKE